jgi:hypothetical protein
MRTHRDRAGYLDRSLLLFLLALFLLVSPLKGLWAAPELPWYTPYLLWGGIILLALRVQRRNPHEL